MLTIKNDDIGHDHGMNSADIAALLDAGMGYVDMGVVYVELDVSGSRH